MRLSKRKPSVTTYVTLTNRDTKKSKHVTVYDASPNEIIRVIREYAGGRDRNELPQSCDGQHSAA